MARLPRFDVPGHPQHVIQRGNNRSTIFVGEEDYEFYVKKLGEACKKHQCDLHAYVLMTDHVHLLVTPHLKGGIGKVMQCWEDIMSSILIINTTERVHCGKAAIKQRYWVVSNIY